MRSQRMTPLLQVAHKRQDAAAKEMASRSRQLGEAEQRLDALRAYVAEYARQDHSASFSHPALLANRQAFREKLDAAVAEQSRVVDRSRQECDVERARLLLASKDAKVMEKLAASYRADELRAGDKRVQNELDDLGARSVRAHSDTGSTEQQA